VLWDQIPLERRLVFPESIFAVVIVKPSDGSVSIEVLDESSAVALGFARLFIG
jgi:hypothetical protein